MLLIVSTPSLYLASLSRSAILALSSILVLLVRVPPQVIQPPGQPRPMPVLWLGPCPRLQPIISTCGMLDPAAVSLMSMGMDQDNRAHMYDDHLSQRHRMQLLHYSLAMLVHMHDPMRSLVLRLHLSARAPSLHLILIIISTRRCMRIVRWPFGIVIHLHHPPHSSSEDSRAANSGIIHPHPHHVCHISDWVVAAC